MKYYEKLFTPVLYPAVAVLIPEPQHRVCLLNYIDALSFLLYAVLNLSDILNRGWATVLQISVQDRISVRTGFRTYTYIRRFLR